MPHVAALVTGVGYIGAALVSRLLARGEPVVGLESFYCTPRAALAHLAETPGLTLLEGDVASPADVARAFGAIPRGAPLTVYHLAAQPSAAVAAQQPEETERTNLVGARLVLEAARARGARVVFGGSFRVYGDDLAGSVVDEQAPYGRVGDLSHLSKVYVEQLARMLGVSFVAVRLGVVYGLAPVIKLEPAFMTVPHLFAHHAVRGEALRVHADHPVGFIHVADAVRALLVAAGLVEDGAWLVVNAAPEVRHIGQVALTVQRLARERGRAVEVLGAAAGTATFTVRSRLDACGFLPERSMDDALGEVVDYFLEQAA